jgi:hypothetical protein
MLNSTSNIKDLLQYEHVSKDIMNTTRNNEFNKSVLV